MLYNKTWFHNVKQNGAKKSSGISGLLEEKETGGSK